MLRTERIDQRIQELEERLAQHRAQLERLKIRKLQADRKTQTRRKILVGAVVLKKAAQDPAIEAQLLQWLTEGLTAQRDRDLFELPAPEMKAPQPPEVQTASG